MIWTPIKMRTAPSNNICVFRIRSKWIKSSSRSRFVREVVNFIFSKLEHVGCKRFLHDVVEGQKQVNLNSQYDNQKDAGHHLCRSIFYNLCRQKHGLFGWEHFRFFHFVRLLKVNKSGHSTRKFLKNQERKKRKLIVSSIFWQIFFFRYTSRDF